MYSYLKIVLTSHALITTNYLLQLIPDLNIILEIVNEEPHISSQMPDSL